ncbi:MAG: hypothetical protein IJ706_09625 [Clostridia bacterium]|nr:hypothetical protein [Clostridia bacterium]
MNNIVIFGDSYSTYERDIPNGYLSYYSPNGHPEGPDVTKMKEEETWWKQLIGLMDGKLLLNNSWSGSTIGYTGYDGADCSKSSSFIYRYNQLKNAGFFETNNVDTVFVFGGTNDSWANAPLGELKFADWVEKDLFNVLPAISYFAYQLKNDLPNAKIILIINTEIKEEIQDALEKVAAYYDLQSIRLINIDKECGHPTKKGMKDICNQILKALL